MASFRMFTAFLDGKLFYNKMGQRGLLTSSFFHLLLLLKLWYWYQALRDDMTGDLECDEEQTNREDVHRS